MNLTRHVKVLVVPTDPVSRLPMFMLFMNVDQLGSWYCGAPSALEVKSKSSCTTSAETDGVGTAVADVDVVAAALTEEVAEDRADTLGVMAGVDESEAAAVVD